MCCLTGRRRPQSAQTGWMRVIPCAPAATRACTQCGERRRIACRDPSGNPVCAMCLRRNRSHAEQAVSVTRITAVLASRTELDAAALNGVLTALGRRRGYLAALAEQLKGHDWASSEMSFEVARLVIALRAAGVDLPAPSCQSCGDPTGHDVSTTGSRIRCRACVRLCPGCGKSRRTEGEKTCRWCRRERTRNRGTCVDCARPNKIRDRDDRCHACSPQTARRCADCGQAHRTGLTRTGESWICRHCALQRAVDPVLPAANSGALQQLRTAVLAAEPLTTRRWITRPEIADLIIDLRTGRLPLTHAALDAQPPSLGLEHLRDLLAAAGALPIDDTRVITRFEHDAQQMLAALLPAHGRLVRSWLRWKVLPHLYSSGGRIDLIQATTNARRALGQVVAFVSTLEHAGTSLQGCRQCQIDDWFATSVALRHQVRPFLAWMQRTDHLSRNLALPGSYRGRPERRTDPEQRWSIARRLITDETLDSADRVAGALVVLYAQPLGRIVTLTTDHVGHNGEDVTLRLGSDLLDLAQPFANLVRSLPQRRRNGTAEQLPAPWLFPGYRAGRHISAAALGNRLRDLGIEPQRARLAALDQLSKEVPPAVLAGVLGIHPSSAVATTNRSGGDWARYAART